MGCHQRTAPSHLHTSVRLRKDGADGEYMAKAVFVCFAQPLVQNEGMALLILLALCDKGERKEYELAIFFLKSGFRVRDFGLGGRWNGSTSAGSIVADWAIIARKRARSICGSGGVCAVGGNDGG
uniref:Uncharacterized protein n=1 Tax=mine drainage metagenome TaxID=410659 RepID=E6QMD2_9ZZZZ